MVRRLPTAPQNLKPGLASQSSSPSHRCRERGLLLLGGLSQSSPPSRWQHAAAEKVAYSILEVSMLDLALQPQRRRGAHPLYRSEPARPDECQCTGNWTRVSQRVRYLLQTLGLLLIHNPSAEWTEATVACSRPRRKLPQPGFEPWFLERESNTLPTELSAHQSEITVVQPHSWTNLKTKTKI